VFLPVCASVHPIINTIPRDEIKGVEQTCNKYSCTLEQRRTLQMLGSEGQNSGSWWQKNMQFECEGLQCWTSCVDYTVSSQNLGALKLRVSVLIMNGALCRRSGSVFSSFS